LTIRELFEFSQNQYWAKRWSKSSCTIMPSPNFRERSRFPGHKGAFDSNLGNAYAVSGRREEAIKIIKDLESRHDQNPSLDADIALAYVGLGDQDQAISWLNKGYEARFKASILLRPAFDPLRSDARFKELMRRVGLPG
jgi:tetratricopeptide (TPR) repeat protein